MITLRRIFHFGTLLALIIFVGSQIVSACDKHAFLETTLEKYEESKFVVIGRGVSVEKPKAEEKSYSRFGLKAIKMVVERSFKGSFSIGEEIVLVEGNGNDDVDSFRESDVGRSYLLFLCASKKSPNIFQVLRGLNHWLADEKAAELRYRENSAAEDLLYLENRDSLRGRTRIYGTIGINQDTYSQMGKSSVRIFKNLNVSLTGNGKTYETRTNDDGVYEFYDLPAGKYTISPEIPKGWEITDVSSFGTSGGDSLENDSQVELKQGRHAFYKFDLHANTTVAGKVIDPTGNPMNGVCLELQPVTGKSSNSYLTNACTDDDGDFQFEQIVAGDYLIVVNNDNKISSSEPFRIAYYPNVFERERAGTITVYEGENLSGIKIKIPKIRDLITVRGRFLSSDGVPVISARIGFKPVETDKNTDGSASTLTDGEGRFSIKLLKDLKGTLTGFLTPDIGQFSACPEVVKMINESGKKSSGDRKSNGVEILTGENREKIELRLSFPSCNQSKIISLMRVD